MFDSNFPESECFPNFADVDDALSTDVFHRDVHSDANDVGMDLLFSVLLFSFFHSAVVV